MTYDHDFHESLSTTIGHFKKLTFAVHQSRIHSLTGRSLSSNLWILQVEALDVAELLPALEALATLRQHGSEEACRPGPSVREDETPQFRLKRLKRRQYFSESFQHFKVMG